MVEMPTSSRAANVVPVHIAEIPGVDAHLMATLPQQRGQQRRAQPGQPDKAVHVQARRGWFDESDPHRNPPRLLIPNIPERKTSVNQTRGERARGTRGQTEKVGALARRPRGERRVLNGKLSFSLSAREGAYFSARPQHRAHKKSPASAGLWSFEDAYALLVKRAQHSQPEGPSALGPHRIEQPALLRVCETPRLGSLLEVDEEILPLRLLNESVALLGTKPLDSPLSQPYDLRCFGATRLSGPPLSKHAARPSARHAVVTLAKP